MIPLAVQLYSLREQAQNDLVGVLKAVAAMGYRGVELAGLYNRKPAELRRLIEDCGLVICATHGPWPTRDTVHAAADTVRALGTDTLVTGFGPDRFQSADKIRATAEELHAVAEPLMAAGLTVALHNHHWEFERVEGRLAYDLFVELCPQVKLEVDVYWAANFGACNPAEVVARHRARTILLHLKDGPLVRNAPMTAVGAGRVDIPAVVRAADPAVLRWLIVELDTCATDMTAAVAASYRYLVRAGLGAGTRPA